MNDISTQLTQLERNGWQIVVQHGFFYAELRKGDETKIIGTKASQ